MFRFVIPILAGIGLGALLFGGAGSAGLWLLAAIPLFIFFKIALLGIIFGVFAGIAPTRTSTPGATSASKSGTGWRTPGTRSKAGHRSRSDGTMVGPEPVKDPR